MSFRILLPLHSVAPGRGTEQGVSRGVMVERMLRAAKERSCAFFYCVPISSNRGSASEIPRTTCAASLRTQNGGYETGCPSPTAVGQSLLAAVAVRSSCLLRMNYLWRLRRSEESVLSPSLRGAPSARRRPRRGGVECSPSGEELGALCASQWSPTPPSSRWTAGGSLTGDRPGVFVLVSGGCPSRPSTAFRSTCSAFSPSRGSRPLCCSPPR